LAQYRSKPKTVEAVQWFPDKDVPGVFREDPNDHSRQVYEPEPAPAEVRYFVVTIHRQRAYLDPGDYVITEPDGIHHYPCRPDIFEEKYRPLPDSPRKAIEP
jgi:hypothetical protein